VRVARSRLGDTQARSVADASGTVGSTGIVAVLMRDETPPRWTGSAFFRRISR